MHFEGLDIILFLTMEYFPGVGKIQYEGSASMNDLAFKWYNADQVVLGKVGLYLQLSATGILSAIKERISSEVLHFHDLGVTVQILLLKLRESVMQLLSSSLSWEWSIIVSTIVTLSRKERLWR